MKIQARYKYISTTSSVFARGEVQQYTQFHIVIYTQNLAHSKHYYYLQLINNNNEYIQSFIIYDTNLAGV